MCGDERFLTSAVIRLTLIAAICGPAAAQVITSLQSSKNGNPAANITSITGGSPLPNGFTIYINAAPGSFDPFANSVVINWNNQGGGTSLSFAATLVVPN